MICKSLTLQQFRNYSHCQVSWADHINIIHGNNGSGKTSLLEALYYLCFTMSYVSKNDRDAVNHKSHFFTAKGIIEYDNKIKTEISCSYTPTAKKRIHIDGEILKKRLEWVGKIPVILISVYDQDISHGSSQYRRFFLDQCLCQLYSQYLYDLSRYKKVLKQKNYLLKLHKPESDIKKLVLPWHHQLAKLSAQITLYRHNIIKQLEEYMNTLSNQLGYKNTMTIEYVNSLGKNIQYDIPYLENAYYKSIDAGLSQDIKYQYATVGIHRDDMTFIFNNQILRKYCSQGQHRFWCILLKLSQLLLFKSILKKNPILLIDDMFNILDHNIIYKLWDILKHYDNQIFITTPIPLPMQDSHIKEIPITYYQVENNTVLENNP